MLLKFELKKIFNSISMFILLLLLALNLLLLSSAVPDDVCNRVDIIGIVELYSKNPSQYYAARDRVLKAYSSAISEGYISESFEFSSDGSDTDYELFAEADKFIKAIPHNSKCEDA